MKLGWINDAEIRNKSSSQFERFLKTFYQSKLDGFIINGNYTGVGYDLKECVHRLTLEKPLIFLLLGSKDFKHTDTNILTQLQDLETWVKTYKQNKVTRLTNIGIPVGETIIVGGDGFFDGINLSDEFYPEEFESIIGFNRDWKHNLNFCTDLAKVLAEDLAETLENTYKYNPKKVIIFTPYPGSEKSMDFGGKNIVPKNARGMYVNRFIYPAIKKLISSHRKVRHILIAGSPLSNNTNMIAPNFKEIVCCRTAFNKDGKKDIALHTLTI